MILRATAIASRDTTVLVVSPSPKVVNGELGQKLASQGHHQNSGVPELQPKSCKRGAGTKACKWGTPPKQWCPRSKFERHS